MHFDPWEFQYFLKKSSSGEQATASLLALIILYNSW